MLKSFIFFFFFLALVANSSAQYHFDLFSRASTGGEPVDKVTGIGVLPSGNVYFGTESQGLLEYDGFGNWEDFNFSGSANFPNDYITSVFVRNSEVWFSTRFGGIGKKTAAGFSKITSSATPLPDDETYGIYADGDGILYIPTFSGFAIDTTFHNSWKVYNKANTPSLPTESFYHVYAEPSGIVWAGTAGEGIGRLKNKSWQFYKSSNSPLPDNNINAIEGTPDGHVWAGTDKGLARFDGNGWTVYTFTSTKGALPGNKIQAMAVDPTPGNVKLYVGTDQGIGVYTYNTGNWSSVTSANSNLTVNSIRAMAVDPNTKALWIASSEGVAVSTTILALGDKELLYSDLHIYPNPVHDLLSLSVSSMSYSQVHLSLVSISGNEVKDLGIHELVPGANVLRQELGSQEAGFYFLILESGSSRTVRKISVY